MPAVTNVVVYSHVLFASAGVVKRWANEVARELEGFCQAAAPVNKRQNKSFHPSTGRPLPVGGLKASISGGCNRVGSHQLDIVVSVDAPYALFVIKGTSDGIMARPPKPYMVLPLNGGWMRARHKVVSGQRANNFMGKGAAATSARHSSLRGMGNSALGW